MTLPAAHAGNCSLLIFLNFSSAFVSLHHANLLNSPKKQAVTWFFFLSLLWLRMFFVTFVPYSTCHVPKATILSHPFSSVYMLPLQHYWLFFGISLYCIYPLKNDHRKQPKPAVVLIVAILSTNCTAPFSYGSLEGQSCFPIFVTSWLFELIISNCKPKN